MLQVKRVLFSLSLWIRAEYLLDTYREEEKKTKCIFRVL
jgi:hypothetical protein